MEWLERVACRASARRKGMRTYFVKRRVFGAWLCWLLLVGLTLPLIATAQTVTYVHTDALGSVVAETDESGSVIKRYDYEPYGGVVGGQVADGPGYTGHVSDAATGLSYMQQRYYDPMIGRFLSTDPVGPDVDAGANFNRYKYAANNPYSFKDPDGRQECRSCEMFYGASVGYMLRDDPDRMRVWAGGEAAATTTGSGAMEGAALGQAVGDFVDTGKYSQQAVTTLAAVVVVGALTHGKSGAGPMHGPSPKINLGQQGKHLVGHNNYIPGRSVLTGNPGELGRSAGTGQQVGKVNVGLPGSKERVSFGQEVGSYVDPAGNATPTTNAIIHYGKDGIHIVPSRPDP
ncbi:RHS repeat-associated core domain-containing protein [Stenotrophomonas sp. C2852]|uniref:RHS repeat-associated core domain-containing protein n=1 Tax=Stenotrophomonas sp. C2852 TaxID=3077845 RepID=UPI00293C83FA|nr:RHS repeat-associated core domain-containing protein [Stenotrophomonas sp. C2852]MDV3434681.1 RHS repeat-associated core domain-containing protein [Stenotrophomonas sp. C2852]